MPVPGPSTFREALPIFCGVEGRKKLMRLLAEHVQDEAVSSEKALQIHR